MKESLTYAILTSTRFHYFIVRNMFTYFNVKEVYYLFTERRTRARARGSKITQPSEFTCNFEFRSPSNRLPKFNLAEKFFDLNREREREEEKSKSLQSIFTTANSRT